MPLVFCSAMRAKVKVERGVVLYEQIARINARICQVRTVSKDKNDF